MNTCPCWRADWASFQPYFKVSGGLNGNQFERTVGGGDVLRRIDHDVAILPSVLRIEDVSTKRINQVQPLVPERQALLALNIRAVECSSGMVEELR